MAAYDSYKSWRRLPKGLPGGKCQRGHEVSNRKMRKFWKGRVSCGKRKRGQEERGKSKKVPHRVSAEGFYAGGIPASKKNKGWGRVGI